MKTQVAIIGSGPAGMMLAHLLHQQGVECIVLERQSREYVLARIRAGVLEHGFAALMREAQCGERMDREGEIHEGFYIANHGNMQRVDLHRYSGGSSVVVYGQTELTRDLYDARDRMKGVVIHNAEDVQPHELTSARPHVTYRSGEPPAGMHGVKADVTDPDSLDAAFASADRVEPEAERRAQAHTTVVLDAAQDTARIDVRCAKELERTSGAAPLR